MEETQLYPWLQPWYKRFIRTCQRGTMPHALLLTGASGIGKKRLANALAGFLHCQQKDGDQQPCGHCSPCRLYRLGHHADALRLSGTQGVEEARQLCHKMGLSSRHQGTITALVSDAEELNRFAANALLKWLEEPAPNRIFILCCQHAERLPATLRSRCIRYHLLAPPREQGIAWLQQQGIEQAPLLLTLSRDCPGQALTWAQKGWLEERNKRFASLQELCRSCPDPLRLATGEDSLEHWRGWLEAWVGDMIRLRLLPASQQGLHHPDLHETLAVLGSKASLPRLFDFLRRLWRLDSNVLNQKLQAEAMLSELLSLLRPDRFPMEIAHERP